MAAKRVGLGCENYEDKAKVVTKGWNKILLTSGAHGNSNILMLKLKMGCNNVVRLGSGHWGDNQQPQFCWDGHKYACEDDFTGGEPCLVYSFGVFNDASFEEVMAARGMTAL